MKKKNKYWLSYFAKLGHRDKGKGSHWLTLGLPLVGPISENKRVVQVFIYHISLVMVSQQV